MEIHKSNFGKLANGQQANLYELSNDNGMVVKITNYGGIVTSILVPDKHGNISEVVLGFNSLEDYEAEHPYLGAIIGRYANRVAAGRFKIGDKEYSLALNNGHNHLHGGKEGFDKKLWTAWKEKSKDQLMVKMAYESPDMEEGYPGNLLVEVIYSLNNNNELIIKYKAKTDKITHINLTNHSYFNLNSGIKSILKHQLKLEADYYTVVDQDAIPTGEIAQVDGTAFDFKNKKAIGKDIHDLKRGYDHNFILNKAPGELKWFARVEDPDSGRFLDVATTEPGVQFYTGNLLRGIENSNGIVFGEWDAFCLETQHFPDSPNKPDFPSTILKPDEIYHQETIYKFGVL